MGMLSFKNNSATKRLSWERIDTKCSNEECEIYICYGFRVINERLESSFRCINCVGKAFSTQECPFGHKLEFSMRSKECNRCLNSRPGNQCAACGYFICTTMNCMTMAKKSRREAILKENHSIEGSRFHDFSSDVLVTGSSNIESGEFYLNTYSSFKKTAKVKAHSAEINAITAVSDTLFASASNDCTVKIWDLNSLACVSVCYGHSNSVTSVVKASEFTIVSGSADDSIRVWDLKDMKEPITLKLIKTSIGGVCCLELLNQNMVAVSGVGNGYFVLIWDIVTGKCVHKLAGHFKQVQCLLKLTNSIMASAGHDGRIYIWNYETGSCIKFLEAHNGLIEAMIKWDNGQILSGGTLDGTMKLWDYQHDTCFEFVDKKGEKFGEIKKIVKKDSSQVMLYGRNNVKVVNL